MKKLVITSLLLCALSSLSTPSTTHAQSFTIPPSSWNESGFDNIWRVQTNEAGFVVILQSNTYQGHTASCNAGRQFMIRRTDPNYDTHVSTLMAAFLSGRRVLIYWTESDSCRAYVARVLVE